MAFVIGVMGVSPSGNITWTHWWWQ